MLICIVVSEVRGDEFLAAFEELKVKMKRLYLQVEERFSIITLNLLLIPKFIKEGWQVHYNGDKHGIEYQESISQIDDLPFW